MSRGTALGPQVVRKLAAVHSRLIDPDRIHPDTRESQTMIQFLIDVAVAADITTHGGIVVARELLGEAQIGDTWRTCSLWPHISGIRAS